MLSTGSKCWSTISKQHCSIKDNTSNNIVTGYCIMTIFTTILQKVSQHVTILQSHIANIIDCEVDYNIDNMSA
jgi:hypothetical protein